MRYLSVLPVLFLVAACATGPEADYPRLVPKSSLLEAAPLPDDPSAAVLARAAALNSRANDLRALDDGTQ